ncbi:MAG TPA: tRNA (adenosine(37)-N6)-threonylcarbamoyltransferase complex dimerization subunit type 1 TsaB [Rudaea sp.]|jgi:tRNA threonylcarbamoyladenosine biosynthesis protein TsaB|nr:tRNA (adenosine(37)-N6)-threonylcarbamoyltransferase complex dimerization subunit type 1 TsaB [Rudaea sp.]
MPNIIAIETATEACSAALSVDGRIVERSEIAPRRHAELILPMIESLLAEAGISRAQLDGIAVGRGPGAFTGVRLAIAVAQGLALALDIPIVPVSSLAALAQDAPDAGVPILAVIDARMGEVYASAFRRGADGLVAAVNEESVGQASELLLPQSTQWCIVGTGWDAYRDALAARLPAPPTFADGARFPQARDIARLASPQFAAGLGVPPEQALPVYLRDKVALTLAEQHARR